MTPEPLCRLLPWDSEFFGRTVARLEASRLDEGTAARAVAWCREQRVDCLYFLADSNDAQTPLVAARNQFQLVDIRLTFQQQIGGEPSPMPGNRAAETEAGNVIRPARENDVPLLSALAGRCHRDTRFYFDPHFPQERCDQLYRTWIERSCAGYADAVYVAEHGEEAVGYVVCRRSGEVGEITLIGVDAQARGHGIGQALLRAAQGWFKEKSLRKIRVATQGRNLPAQRLYQRNGFLTQALELYYHRWFL